jgi:peptide/nickel transport system ATP-binding protein
MNDSASPPPLFEVMSLSKRYRVGGLWKPKHLRALHDVSFRVDRSEIVALVGESGSGKSTVARMCVRLDEPSHGRILLDGRDVLRDEPKRVSLAYRKRVQMIFQDPFGSLNPMHSVGRHIERPIQLHHAGLRPNELQTRIATALESVGLSPAMEFVGKRPAELSGGQRQRVAIARALAVEPEIIFADEPVSMLDLSIRAGILNLLLELKESRGISLMYITHDLASARYIADRTMVMYAGQIVESGASDDVLQRPQHPYTKLLIAAVPDLDKPMSRQLPAGSGAPNLIDPPPGCPFAPRCPNVMGSCTTTLPPPIALEGKRIVRCHLFTNSQSTEGEAGAT